MNKNKVQKYLSEHVDYIQEVKKILKYAEEEAEPDKGFIKDTDHKVAFKFSDVNVAPQKLYQLEINGVIDRVFDSHSRTVYGIEDVSTLEQAVNELSIEDGVRREYHNFPSDDELPDDLFEEVIGYDKVKFLLRRGMTTNEITNFLFVGPPGSAKSVFLLAIRDKFPQESQYIMASEASSAGVIDIMFQETPMFMLIDEFDDMDKSDQSAFASYTETGIVKETKYDKTRELETNTMTLGAANDKGQLKPNIRDRFTTLEFDSYTKEEFIEICEHILPMKEGKTEEESEKIAHAVWRHEGEGNVRTAIDVSRLSRGDPEKVVGILEDFSDGSGDAIDNLI